MKEKLFILIVILLAICTTVSSQNKIPVKYKNKQIFIDEVDIITTSRILKEMKLEYKKPCGFKEDPLGDSLRFYPKLIEKLYSSGIDTIFTKDNQFITFLTAFSIITKKDEKYFNKLSHGKSNDLVDKQHFSQMKAILKSFYGEEMEQKWKEKVTTYPKEEALKKFNADNAYRFSIKLTPEDYYKKEFKYIDLLFLQKKGRGYVYFTCLYTDKAKANLNKYWRKIEKVLYYKD